jgi:type I restriction enzyme S subunit
LQILTAFDDKIELLQAQNKTLETTAQTIFKEWFGKYKIGDELPEGWRVGKYGELVNLSSGKGVKKSEYIENGQYEIIGANGLLGRLDKFLINEKVIITGRVGTLGTVYIINKLTWISDNVLISKPIINNSFYFTYFTLKTFDFSTLNTGSTQPLITQSALKSVEIKFPDKLILEKFENLSKPLFFLRCSVIIERPFSKSLAISF